MNLTGPFIYLVHVKIRFLCFMLMRNLNDVFGCVSFGGKEGLTDLPFCV